MNARSTSRSAFTLVELLVAIAIIAILMGLVVGISGVANRKSTEAKARSELQTISAALEEYRLVYGSYPAMTMPSQPSGLAILTNETIRIPAELRQGVRLLDPWGRLYIYTNVTRYSYTLFSQGQRTDNAADDIHSGSP
ncbi:MAG TPA: type II secretion system protein GspG [Kiritimatiellia bacterium]|nr:type II secretion system protein GspG [Kiritimatiellia bacterium]